MTRIKSDPEHLDSMKLGGGGRRKQSKPIRVFLEDGETDPSKLPTAPENNSNNEGLIEDMPRSECEMDVDESTMQCDLCNETFTSQTALMEHVQANHTINDENAQDSFPTKYHQLGMELSQTDVVNNEDSTHPSENNHVGNIEKYSDSQGVPCNGSKVRIFHKDAYCEICDREFCNRYFLKTHRANKHGIYDVGNSPPPGSLQMPLPLQPMPPVTSISQFDAAKTVASIPTQPSHKTPTSAEMPKIPIEIVPQNHNSISSFNPPATPPKTNTMSTPTKPTGLSKPAGSSGSKLTPDMEDYCELCQKHFCNKYYLKKHKQDVHGIIPEPSPSTTGKRGRPPMSGQMANMPILGSTPTLPSSTLANLVMPPVSGAMSNGSTNIPGLGNVMLINPFAPPVLIQAPQVLGGLPQGFPPQMGTLPQLPQPATPSSESPKSTSSSITTNVSSANVPINNEALRSMGVLNAEAYCELCRKEFCNKYFLRIHKANKHGIFTDEGLSPPAGTQGQSGLPVLNVPALPNAGDLPPGTINITPTNDSESQAVKPEEGKMERSPVGGGEREIEKGEIKQHMAPDEICNLCKKEFANKYSLKVHMINAHGMTIPDFDLMPPKDNKMRLDKQASMQGGAMFGNMIAAKLADRVMCDICNKEVCNKYFLKTHKVKVHGMDPAVAEKEINMMSFSMRDKESPMKNKPIAPMPPMSVVPTTSAPLNSLSKPSSPPSESSTPNSTDVPRPKDEDLLKMGIDPEAYCEICKKEFCSKYFLKTHKQNIHGIKSDNGIGSLMQGALPFSQMVTSSSDGQLLFSHSNNNNKLLLSGNTSPTSLPDSEKGKDQRVVCELCNKEMCNKFFLRTHMLNKHGINMDYGPIGNPFLPAGLPGMPYMPSLDKPLEMQMNLFNPSFLARMQEEISQPLDLKKPVSHSPTSMEKKPIENGTKETLPSTLTPSAWHVPAKKEGNMQLSLQKCDICGLMFGEKVTLQLHMIQDHPGQVTVSTKNNSEEKSYLSGNIALSLRKKYQKGRRIRGHFRKLFSGIGKGIQNGNDNGLRKKFRCAYCKVRFTSKVDCQAHIRSAHPKAKSTSDRNPNEASRMKAAEEQQIIEAVPMPNGVDNNSKLLMQPFSIEGQGQFAPATLYLPVYEKIDQPMAVTFTLKPKSTEQ